MKRITALFIAISLAIFAVAQQCPRITMTCNSDLNKAGTPGSFSIQVSGGDPNIRPTYNWTVSAGSISSGQGTSSITVVTDGLAGQTITATADIGGFDRSCSSTASCTIMMAAAEAEMISSGVYSSTAAFNAAVNQFTRDYSEYDIDIKRVIVIYPGKDSKSANTVASMKRSIKAAFERNKIPADAYEVITRAKRTRTGYAMWKVPAGTEVPADN